jgi:hypothetical protein
LPLDSLRRDRTRVPFEIKDAVGAPSRWITLCALRVHDWCNQR